MSYRFAYPTGYGIDPAMISRGYDYRRSYSPESFSSDSEASDDYEYRGRVITRETRCPQDVVRAPTPPPIIKRVVERAPTPEAPIMERVIIRPQAQEIVERVIEQPRTPPPRIVQKEMHEEAPPPIVRTRVIKVDRPIQCGYSQPGSPFGNQPNVYRAQSIVGSVGPPAAFPNANPGYSSASSFEYGQPLAPPMMMPQGPQPAAQMMYHPQNYMYRPFGQPPMPFAGGYRPMMPQQTRMIPHGMPMPMMAPGNTLAPMLPNYNPMAQQLVY